MLDGTNQLSAHSTALAMRFAANKDGSKWRKVKDSLARLGTVGRQLHQDVRELIQGGKQVLDYFLGTNEALYRDLHHARLTQAIQAFSEFTQQNPPSFGYLATYQRLVENLASPADRKAMSKVIELAQFPLHNNGNHLKVALMDGLAQIKDDQLRETWIDALMHSRDKDIRSAATMSLLLIKNQETRDAFIELASLDNHWETRFIATQIIPYHSNRQRQLELLRQLQNDSHRQIRLKVGMVCGKHTWRKSFFGTWYFPSLAQLAALPQPANLPHINLTKGMEHEAKLKAHNTENLALAGRIARNIQDLSASQPGMRQHLMAFYGDPNHVPTAGEILNQFTLSAQGHLKTQQTGWQKFRNRPLDELDIAQTTRMLLEIAEETGHYFGLGDLDKTLILVNPIYEQRQKVEQELQAAQRLLGQHGIAKAQAQKLRDQQQAKVDQMSAPPAEGAPPTDAQKLKVEKEILKLHQERFTLAEGAYTIAEAKVNAHVAELTRYRLELNQAIHSAVTGSLLPGMTSSDIKSTQKPLTAQQAVEAAQDKRYDALAELEAKKPALQAQGYLDEARANTPKTKTAGNNRP